MDWLFFNPVKIRSVARAELAAAFQKQENALLITYEGAVEMFALQDAVAASGIRVFDQVPANPTVDSVAKVIRLVAEGNVKRLIALGGGSAIDTAKSVAVLHTLGSAADGAQVRRAIRTKSFLQETDILPWVAVPTTAGTGADVTMWGTVWDPEENAKLSIEAETLYAAESWLVPALTHSMPPRLTLSTGLDALSHATEAYWAKSSNGLVRALAAGGIRGIVEQLPLVLANGADAEARRKMLEYATLAGMAFSNTRTTACHALSYPLTLAHQLDHGLSCALTLGAVAEVNEPALLEKDRLLAAYGVPSVQDIQQKIDDIAAPVMKLRLSSFGLTAADALACWQGELVPERLGNNPVPLSPADLQHIAARIA